jgi:DNA-binding LytR/AlgR family response regulator
MKIKLVLVENDEDIRQQLKDLLVFYNLFEIINDFDNVNDANDFICTNQVDAVFINTEAGNAEFSGDGSYLAINLSQKYPDLIIIMYSLKEQNASRIMEMNCTDFFTLPFDGMTMQRVVNHIEYIFDLLQYKRQLVNRSIMIKTNMGYQLVPLDNILFIERFNRKNRMVTTDGKEIILGKYSLDELEEIFRPNNFYRCYQSFIVNLSKVSFIKINNETKNYVLLFDNYAGEVMLSRQKYNEVIELLKNK